ncbi:arylsulfatase [Rubripirellula reticaptiva]|uniref:Arylsulfatase n=1 Tax=Rubripirellula reticaptiva TaxID=2528013 RepID=A0A5C6ESV8_9BACT|nr:arylsulfatase [Rubripirellula reticaptiva]TWU51745.1 Arylsulfatase [Rubripirellula reticaptiva]
MRSSHSRNSISILVLAVSIGMMLASHVSAQRPNFLVIIADDLGYSDVGCYGSEIATPNLDGLAAGGLKFTQFYNTARCWPTRSALLTGYYPQQIRRDGMPGAPSGFGGSGKRPAWAQTIADYLRPAGYRSYHSGKWHVDGKPTDNGFDLSDEATRSHGFFDSIKREDRDPDFYRTTATADHAIECLQQHAAEFADQPFFQYVAFHAPHFPLHALPEDIERYRDRYVDGWDALREERHKRQQALGITSAELSKLEEDVGPPYAFPDQIALLGPGEINRPLPWGKLTQQQQRFQATKMAIHAAMIDRMDQEIGRIVEQLRSMSAFEDTLILFLSDNGASAEMMVRGEGHDPSAAPGSAATYLCLGPGFSSAANTPFRRHKTWVHEGGISTPLIAHWPKRISARNELRWTIGHVIDIAPTILDFAGVEPASSSVPAMIGKSLAPVLLKGDVALNDEIWFYHEGNRALRQGDWKIVHGNVARDFPWGRSKAAANETDQAEWSLYDLSTDRAEQNDVASDHPEIVAAMQSRWLELRDQFLRDSASALLPSTD